MSRAAPSAGGEAARTYADYAAALAFSDLPPSAVEAARRCLVDAVGCAVFGRGLPWSRIVLAEAAATGSGGPCRLPGEAGPGLHPPQAALVLGSLAHAFELDSLRMPGAGVHPGATVALPAFAVAQAVGASSEAVVAAIVAGCEVMFRIGSATLHSPEKIGFHAPGLTGPIGAALATAKLLELSAEQTANAICIAASFGGGLLAFARAAQGGMVKRLHMGRAAEGGVLAARLASRGYEAPHSAIDGPFGFLDAFCPEARPDLLLAGLGERFEIETLCLKRYACHITAHAPVQRLRAWMAEHGFGGDDIARIDVRGSRKLVSHHSGQRPADLMLAQYSVPFTLALSAYREPENPRSFDEEALRDRRILDLAGRIETGVRDGAGGRGWGVDLRVELHDGRVLDGTQESFLGMPTTPMGEGALRAKFLRLTVDLGTDEAEALYERVAAIGAG